MNQTANSEPPSCCLNGTCCCCQSSQCYCCCCYRYDSHRSRLMPPMLHLDHWLEKRRRTSENSFKIMSRGPLISCLLFGQQKEKYQRQMLAQRLPSASTSTPRTSAPAGATTTSTITSGSLIPLILVTCTLILTTVLQLSGIANGVVVHQIRFIENKTGRTDYALAGETIELSCYYMMKDEAEDVKQIIWSKDGKNFLKWRKSKAGLEVLNYTFKGHIDQTSINSHLIIHNVTIDMHGKYKCQVKTDLGIHELEQDLIVISHSSCKSSDWRIMSDQLMCREQFKLDCRNMFPKPVPSCGLWNDKLDKFIRSVTVDISEEPNKETYRVKYLDKFDLPTLKSLQQMNVTNSPTPYSNTRPTHVNQTLAFNLKTPPTTLTTTTSYNTDLLQYAGHLTFKCDIIVPETSWKLSLAYKMFDYSDGCHLDPLETIERMRQNYSHFATTRMEQAGFLPFSDHSNSNAKSKSNSITTLTSGGRHGSKVTDELEMLASSLRYELIPSPRSKSSKIELNCWQKPKPGTLARLSCVKSNQVKLIGTNLLECRPGGQWHPVSLDVSNKILGKSGQLASLAGSHSVGRKIPRKYRSDQQHVQSANRLDGSTLAEKLSTASSPSPDAGKVSSTGPSVLHEPVGIGSDEKRNRPVDNNDASDIDDDDNDDSTTTNKMPTTEMEGSSLEQSIPIATLASTTITTESTTTTTITTTTNTMESSSPYEPLESSLELSNLTPAQLAALLPNCVSTVSRGPKFQHHRLPPSNSASNNNNNNRLMPQDEAVVLESHYSQRDSKFQTMAGVQHPSSKYQREHHGATSNGNQTPDTDPFNWNWLSIFATSSSSSSTTINSNQRSLIISTIWLATMALVLLNLFFGSRILHIA